MYPARPAGEGHFAHFTDEMSTRKGHRATTVSWPSRVGPLQTDSRFFLCPPVSPSLAGHFARLQELCRGFVFNRVTLPCVKVRQMFQDGVLIDAEVGMPLSTQEIWGGSVSLSERPSPDLGTQLCDLSPVPAFASLQ